MGQRDAGKRQLQLGKFDGTSIRRSLQSGAGRSCRFWDGEYLSSLIDYLHLNPVRAGLIELQANRSLSEYRWYYEVDALWITALAVAGKNLTSKSITSKNNTQSENYVERSSDYSARV
jgi:hypothetical protein